MNQCRFFVVAAAVVSCWPSTGLRAQAPTKLAKGDAIERTIAGNEVHAFTIVAKVGEHVQFVAEQRGIDVVLTLVGPGSVKVREFDSPNGNQGPEELEFIAQLAGTYRIEVRRLNQPPNPASGKYDARLIDVRAATPAELARVEDEKSLARLERIWDDAVRAIDLEAIGKMITDDFISPSSFAGQAFLNKTQYLAQFKSLKEARHGTTNASELDDTGLRVVGDRAVATGRFLSSQTWKGRTSRFRGRFVHVWQKRDGSWLMAVDHWYFTDPVSHTRTAVVLEPSALTAFAGAYDVTDGPILQVTASEGGLVATAEGEVATEHPPWSVTFIPESANEFFAKDDDMQLLFVRDDGGTVRRVMIVDHGRASRGKKVG